MILDTKLSFTGGPLAITTSKASTILDAKAIRDFGRGQEVYLNIYLTTIFTSTTANQLTVQIISSSGADPGSSDVFEMVPINARSTAQLQQTGCIYRAAWPVGVPYERVGLYFLATTALAAGAVDAFLTLGQAEDPILLT